MTENELNNKKDKLRLMVAEYSEAIYERNHSSIRVLQALLSGEMVSELHSAEKYELACLENSGFNPDTFHQDMMKVVNDLKQWPETWNICTPFKDLDHRYQEIIQKNKREDLLE